MSARRDDDVHGEDVRRDDVRDEPASVPTPAEPAFNESGHEESDAQTAWLTEVLDSEAGQYEPDSQRIRATLHERLDGAARGHRRSSILRIRLAGIPAGIAVAALCATVAVAVTATVASRPSQQAPTSVGGSALPAVSTSPSANASAQPAPSGTQNTVTGLTASAQTASRSPSPPASGSAAGSAGGTGNVITAVGAVDQSSNASWSQENVNITLTEPVTAFQLSVKVSMSAGVSSTSEWTNYDITMFDVTVDTKSDGVTYKFQLKPGKSLPAGSAEFAVQFAHGAGHNPAYDTYYVSVISDKAHGSTSGASQGAF